MGHTGCLYILQQFGFEITGSTWARAAGCGHISCLRFAIANGYWLDDHVLEAAVYFGRLACVEFLIQQGLPHEPYMHFIPHVYPDQQQCIQLMVDNKVQINPASLIVAAGCGDLGFVRWLHKQGVPLWHRACETNNHSIDELWHDRSRWSEEFYDCLEEPRTLPIPWQQSRMVPIWKALRYGSVYGAPVTPNVQKLFERKRLRTHAVLCCFKAAQRRSAPRDQKQMRTWAIMAALPSALVEEILILADLEIPESVMRRRPLQAS